MIFVITGATHGLGLHCARSLSSSGDAEHILLACRDVAAARALAIPRSVVLDVPLDLTSLESVRAYAGALRAWLGTRRINALVNNAGVGGRAGLTPMLTADGFERIWQTNHLGHFLLTLLLLPVLAEGARITNVASEVHDAHAQRIPMMVDPGTSFPEDDEEWESRVARGAPMPGESAMESGSRRYSRSKLCNILFTHELARRLSGACARGCPEDVAAALPAGGRCSLPHAGSITAIAFNPGAMMDGNFVLSIGGPIAAAVAYGCLPLLRVLPSVARLLRSAAESGPVLARIAAPVPAPDAWTAAYYDGPTLQLTSAFSRSREAVTRHQLDLWRLSVGWAQVTDKELREAGVDAGPRVVSL